MAHIALQGPYLLSHHSPSSDMPTGAVKEICPFFIISISLAFSSRKWRINLSVSLSLMMAVVLIVFARSAVWWIHEMGDNSDKVTLTKS